MASTAEEQQIQLPDASQFAMTILEMEATHDMFKRMVDACHKKCISKYTEADLTTDEAICDENCALKYILVAKTIGNRLFNRQPQ